MCSHFKFVNLLTLFLVFATLSSVILENVVTRVIMYSLVNAAKMPLYLNLWLAQNDFCVLVLRDKQTR